jgi:large subunit ribosomal protein L13
MNIVIDGSNALLGRLASYAAKQALLGHDVVIVNCKEVVISGNSRSIIAHYRVRRARGGSAQKGPYFPKIAERIVKRTIRGMLPYTQGRGLAAFKKVRCYNELPQEYAEVKKIKAGKEKPIKTMQLSELAREL